MNIFDKLFDNLSIEDDVEKKEEKHKIKKEQKAKDKEKLKTEDSEKEELTKRYFEKCDEVKKLEAKIEELKDKNTLYIDLKNTDDRKKLKELIEEDKILLRHNEPFIVAEVPTFGMNNNNPITHTIYCNDIICADYRIYYLDLTLMPKGQRTKVYERIWIHHTGYSTYDLITREQFEYLLNNGYLKTVNYSHNDLSNGLSFNTDDEIEPTEKFIETTTAKYQKDLDSLKSKKSTNIDKLVANDDGKINTTN